MSQYRYALGWICITLVASFIGCSSSSSSLGTFRVNKNRAAKLTIASTRRATGQPRLTEIVTMPTHGTLSADAGEVFYFPDDDFVGADAFSVTVEGATQSYDIEVAEATTSSNFKGFEGRKAEEKIDFLWILDNSTSMLSPLRYIVNSLNEFTAYVSSKTALDWQMAIGSTDTTFIGTRGSYGLHSGARINTSINEFCTGAIGTACSALSIYARTFDLLPVADAWDDDLQAPRFAPTLLESYDAYKTTSSSEPYLPLYPARKIARGGSPGNPSGPDEFAEMLNDFVPDCGLNNATPIGIMCGAMNPVFGWWEEGLTYMEKLYSDDEVYAQFSRPGVPLAVITISNANDYSCDPVLTANGCTGTSPELQSDLTYYPASRFSQSLKALKAAEGTHAYFFAIVAKDADALEAEPTGCFAESVGTRYVEVAEQMGVDGFVGDICSLTPARSFEDSAFGQIAEFLKERGYLYPKPVDAVEEKVFVGGQIETVTPETVAVGAASYLKLPEPPPSGAKVLILTGEPDIATLD